jgi:hypothetical protein
LSWWILAAKNSGLNHCSATLHLFASSFSNFSLLVSEVTRHRHPSTMTKSEMKAPSSSSLVVSPGHEGWIIPCNVLFDLVVLVWSVFACLCCESVCMLLSHLFCFVEICFLSVGYACL